jgi:hypothetical protein
VLELHSNWQQTGTTEMIFFLPCKTSYSLRKRQEKNPRRPMAHSENENCLK